MFYRAQDHTSVQRLRNNNRDDISSEATRTIDEEMMQYCTQGHRCRYAVLASHVMMPLSYESMMQTCHQHAPCEICENSRYEEVDITLSVREFLQNFERKTLPPHRMLKEPDVHMLLKDVLYMAIKRTPKDSVKKQLCLFLVGENKNSLRDELLRRLTWLNVLKASNSFEHYEKEINFESIKEQLERGEVSFVLKIALDTEESFESMAALEISAIQKESKVYEVEEIDYLDGQAGPAQHDVCSNVRSILGIPDSFPIYGLEQPSTLPFLIQFEMLR